MWRAPGRLLPESVRRTDDGPLVTADDGMKRRFAELQRRLADGDLSVLPEVNRMACERVDLDPEAPAVKAVVAADKGKIDEAADLYRQGRDAEAVEVVREFQADVLGRCRANAERRPRVHLQSIAPVALRGVPVMRSRGQGGRPAARKTAAASSGGSSDDGSGEPAPAPRPADLQVVHVEGERLQQTAIRLGVALSVWAPRGELIVTADEPGLLELVMPLALALVEDRRALKAVGMPLIFDNETWAIRLEELPA